jgi:hypothetical protein
VPHRWLKRPGQARRSAGRLGIAQEASTIDNVLAEMIFSRLEINFFQTPVWRRD